MSICAKLCGNPWDACGGISLKSTHLIAVVAPEEKQCDHRRFIMNVLFHGC